jgi:pimeloyl-ACP methyl ester carboxylesterase
LNNGNRLLLMPGLDGSGELFAPLLPLLDRHFDTIVIRYPDLDSFDDYVSHARAALPDSGPVALLAESFSSPVALALMAEDGARIRGAVLSAGFARSPRPLLSRAARYLPSGLMACKPLYRLGLDFYALGGGDYPRARALSMRLMPDFDTAAMRHRAMLLQRIDVTALLPKIENPVLCLRARRDRVVAARHSDILLRGLRNARCVDIDGPHLLLQARPRECAAQIIRQLAV